MTDKQAWPDPLWQWGAAWSFMAAPPFAFVVMPWRLPFGPSWLFVLFLVAHILSLLCFAYLLRRWYGRRVAPALAAVVALFPAVSFLLQSGVWMGILHNLRFDFLMLLFYGLRAIFGVVLLTHAGRLPLLLRAYGMAPILSVAILIATLYEIDVFIEDMAALLECSATLYLGGIFMVHLPAGRRLAPVIWLCGAICSGLTALVLVPALAVCFREYQWGLFLHLFAAGSVGSMACLAHLLWWKYRLRALSATALLLAAIFVSILVWVNDVGDASIPQLHLGLIRGERSMETAAWCCFVSAHFLFGVMLIWGGHSLPQSVRAYGIFPLATALLLIGWTYGYTSLHREAFLLPASVQPIAGLYLALLFARSPQHGKGRVRPNGIALT